ncbi:MAG: HAD-IA family hydrolase [Anaerolineae bacterium]|nr:HAD-IA family hydrolase [Anaerolineae bacterium]
MIKAVLFDVDGTLLDTHEFVYQAFEHTFRAHALHTLSRASITNLMGKPLETIYQQLAPALDSHQLGETHRAFQETHLHLSQPFPHVRSTLDTLARKGIRLAVTTTRSRRTSTGTLERAGIAACFEVIISAEDVTRHKPDPQPLWMALEKLGVTPAQAVMVGDTLADVQAGKNAGTQTVGVTYGFAGPAIAASQPDHVIDDIASLLDCLDFGG